jgi:hypothetical protein
MVGREGIPASVSGMKAVMRQGMKEGRPPGLGGRWLWRLAMTS